MQNPEALLTFPYNPAGLADGELELWRSELRRNYLHWLILNAVAAERQGIACQAWQVTGLAAVREWLTGLIDHEKLCAQLGLSVYPLIYFHV